MEAILRSEGVKDADELLGKYREYVWRLAYRFLRNADDAADVTQDVLIRLHTHLGKLEPDTRLSAWLTRVTANTALNFSRGRLRRQRYHEKARSAGQPLLQAVGVSEPGVQTSGLARALAKALGELPRGQRAVVTLRLLEERTFREIAETFGVREGTVKVQFARGLHRLREALAEWK
jgi:RNA polymerase sigma-70 factor (ECF subfamily)